MNIKYANTPSKLITMFVAWAVSLLWVSQATAHLMVAQNGTLNIVEDGAFMVVSLPISAFSDVDQDYDQEISLFEFNSRRDDITARIKNAIKLEYAGTPATLQDLRLVPVRPHSKDSVYLSQLIVMGRFDLPNDARNLEFHLSLFGQNLEEQSMKITAKRPGTVEKCVVILTPEAPMSPLFSSQLAQQNRAPGPP